MIAVYCQDEHRGHSYTLKTVVTHEVPKKVEFHHFQPEHKIAPIVLPVIQEVHTIPEIHGTTFSSQSVVQPPTHTQGEIYQEAPERAYSTPKEPAPVYESVEPVRAPVQLRIVQQGAPHAPTHRVVQSVQQIPLKAPVLRVNSVTPIIHPAPIVPIIYQAANAPIIQQAPSQHNIFDVPPQAPIPQLILQETHREPIQHHIVQVARAPVVHHEERHQTESLSLNTESYHEQSSQQESHDEHHHQEVDYYVSEFCY